MKPIALKPFSRPLILGVALMALLSLVFWSTRTGDQQIYSRTVDRLREIRQVDAVLNQDILKCRHGTLSDYDPITKSLNQLRELHRILATEAPVGSGQSEPNGDVAGLGALIGDKEVLVDEFESRNAVLRNSVNYLPIAAAGLAESADRREENGVTDQARALLRDVLVYLLAGTREQIPALELQIRTLAEREPAVPTGQRPGLKLLVAHARMILRQKGEVDSLVSRAIALRSRSEATNCSRPFSAIATSRSNGPTSCRSVSTRSRCCWWSS